MTRFFKIGAVAFVGVLLAFAAVAEDRPDGIRIMAREKSLAEQFMAILNDYGAKDVGNYAKGISLYAEAKADFDGLITELEYELDQAMPPSQSEKFESALKEAVAKRMVFTSFVTDTIIPHSEAAQKGVVGDFIKSAGDLIKALTDSSIAIWHEFKSSSEEKRKEIRQKLEALRWPQFTAPGGKPG